MAPFVPLLLLSVLAPELLGTPLRQDGYQLRPPAGFRMSRMALLSGTKVGAVSLSPDGQRMLSAALVDAEGPQAASMLVAMVDGPFEAVPSTRDDFAAAVARHFREELGIEFVLDTVERVSGPTARIEVRGSLLQEGRVRSVVVAGMEGEERHAVITFSVPSGRFAQLGPSIRASLDSFRPEVRPGRDERGAVVIAGAVLVALALSLSARRRAAKRGQRREP